MTFVTVPALRAGRGWRDPGGRPAFAEVREMTRVLVVHHDIDLADQEVDSLRRFGYQVEQCSGPTANRCPVLAGHTCDLATRADVLVYDAWADGDADGAVHLVERLRAIHPQVPIVLTVPGMALDWIDESGSRAVVPVYGQPTGARLHEAIQQAMAGVAEPAPSGLPVA